jgi:hypothetical protein
LVSRPHTNNNIGWCCYKWSFDNCNHRLKHCHRI